MKRRIAAALAAVAAGALLAGCELPEESLDELMGVPPATAATTVPAETAPSVALTEAPTEPSIMFEAGQEVYAVYMHEGGVGIRRVFAVAVEGETLIATTAIPGSGEAGELMSFPVDNCYTESVDAWAAAGQDPLE